MPDAPADLKAFSERGKQKHGCEFPMPRVVMLVRQAIACVLLAASRAGKEVTMRWCLFMVACAWGLAAWIGYMGLRDFSTHSWPAVPCLIESSFVQDVGGDTPYAFRVSYRYELAGKQYEGRNYNEHGMRSHDIAVIDRLSRSFPIGSERVCYVDPRNPASAVLAHEAVWFTALFSALMFIAGCAFIGLLFPAVSLTRRSLEVVSGPFLIALGLGGYFAFFGLPLWSGLRSLTWRETPCVIESGQVRSVKHYVIMTSFTVYWPDIVYRYEVDGVAYQANTFNASDVGSPWYYGARGVVRRHPWGMKTTCYVNPSDPNQAALARTPSGTHWFGVWPLAIALLGASTVFESITRRVVKFGTPRLWGTLILGALTTSVLTMQWITGADLYDDWRAGAAEWPEYAIAAFAAVMGLGWTVVWVAWARQTVGPACRKPTADKPPVVWDREIDELIKAEPPAVTPRAEKPSACEGS
jgi:hypothetical protein